MSNTVKARLQVKKDTEAHWNLARNFIPLAGEPIVYSVDDTHMSPRLKIGDGTTYVTDLPFITANTISNEYIKSGTTEYWNSQPSFVPDNCTIIIYTDKYNNQSTTIPGIKIGDGNTYCIDLPFINDDITIQLNEHINNTDIHVTPQDKIFWNNKLNYDNLILEENLIFTRN